MHGNVRHMRHRHVPHYEAVPGWLGILSPSPVDNQQVSCHLIWVYLDNHIREQPRGRKAHWGSQSPLIRHASQKRTCSQKKPFRTGWLLFRCETMLYHVIYDADAIFS